MRKLARCALVLLMGPLLACGGSDDSAGDGGGGGADSGGSGEPTFAEWQTSINDVCAEFEPQLAEAQAAQPDPTTSDELVAQIDELFPLTRSYLEALLRVDVPSERSAEIEQLYDDLRDQVKLVQQIRQVASAEGLSAAEPVFDEFSTLSDELNQTAQDLGVPACDSRETGG